MIGVGWRVGGSWTQEGVALGRTGSGRLGLARQTQVDCGGKGESLPPDTAAPTLCRGRGAAEKQEGLWTELTFQGPGPHSPRLWLPSGPL